MLLSRDKLYEGLREKFANEVAYDISRESNTFPKIRRKFFGGAEYYVDVWLPPEIREAIEGGTMSKTELKGIARRVLKEVAPTDGERWVIRKVRFTPGKSSLELILEWYDPVDYRDYDIIW